MSFAGRKPNSFGDVSVRVTGRRNSQRRSIEVCVQKRWEVDEGQREERKILEFFKYNAPCRKAGTRRGAQVAGCCWESGLVTSIPRSRVVLFTGSTKLPFGNGGR